MEIEVLKDEFEEGKNVSFLAGGLTRPFEWNACASLSLELPDGGFTCTSDGFVC